VSKKSNINLTNSELEIDKILNISESPDSVSSHTDDLVKLVLGRIREISKHTFATTKDTEAATDDKTLLLRLRTSRLGLFYLEHLKRHQIIRSAVFWVWREGYPRYISYIASPFLTFKELFKSKRHQFHGWYNLVTHAEYGVLYKERVRQLSPASDIDTPVPLSFPVNDRKHLLSPHKSYQFPEIRVIEVQQAIVRGGTNLVQVSNFILCHDLYDFPRDFTSEELHGRAHVIPEKNKIRWFQHDEWPTFLPCAAVFTDAVAANYAHWLTEVLPRIAMFCAEELYSHVPIVVDSGLHPNLMASLALIVGLQRDIYCLPIGRSVAVEQLYITSTCGYVPFERRNVKLVGHSHGLFSPVALEKMRNGLVDVARQENKVSFPEKVYLRRASGVRKVVNIDELEKVLVENGFGIVEPEKLSFLEQIQLFSNAKVVIGSSGAALANIIFCPPESKIYIIISVFPNTSYWYWQNIACATGKVVGYIFGRTRYENKLGIHSDFYVDPVDLLNIRFEK
jgi:capsular polysaccharide biosynthesis protein